MSESAVRQAPAAARARNLLVLLAALASVVLAFRLAFWQLGRATQEETLQSQLVARESEPPLAASALARRPEDSAAQTYRRVDLVGHWLAERTVFLDNRQMQGKVGFFVVTPFLLDASNDAVLVQRGWVGRNFSDRTALPSLVTPSGRVPLHGTVALAPARLFEFTAAASGPIRQNVDPASFAREIGLAVLPLAIVESATPANAHDGLERHWPAPATNVQMHYGYAFQWFAIGSVIAFLYVWFRIPRPRQRREH
ncbi:MAG: SURF1 family protein [Caldimonas sp.]